MTTRKKRATKKIEIWAKLTPNGITIPSPVNKNRINLLAQSMPPEGQTVKLTLSFPKKSKSGEMMGFYFGAVLPLWVAHRKDLINQWQMESDPMWISHLIKQKKITAKEIEDAHEDFMFYFRPIKSRNWMTGKLEKKRDRLSEMDAYNAALYISEVYQHVIENCGVMLNTEAYKDARDNVDLILQEGPEKAKKELDLSTEKIYKRSKRK